MTAPNPRQIERTVANVERLRAALGRVSDLSLGVSVGTKSDVDELIVESATGPVRRVNDVSNEALAVASTILEAVAEAGRRVA